MIAQGIAWLPELLGGTTSRAIAQREVKSERTIRLTLTLAFLDPQLVRAALHGSLPHGASAARVG